MIRVISELGTFDVEGTAKEVNCEKELIITRNGQVTANFRRWLHWYEINDNTPNN